MNKKIAIIGGGNLGTAIAEGLVKSGFMLPEHIMVTKRNIANSITGTVREDWVGGLAFRLSIEPVNNGLRHWKCFPIPTYHHACCFKV